MKFFRIFLLALLCNSLLVFVVSAATIEPGVNKRNAYQSEHFVFEFSDLILEQVDENSNGLPDLIDVLEEAAEASRSFVIDDLNYPDPLRNTGRKTQIILDDRREYLPVGVLGGTSVFANGDAYIAIDPWLTEQYLEVTMIHEYFHVIQFGYDPAFFDSEARPAWIEATAVWVQDLLYDEMNDYVDYLPDFFDYPDYSIFASMFPRDSLFQYALNIWPRFLAEYYNDDSIRVIWETYFDSSLAYSDDRKLYNAVQNFIQNKGDDLKEVFRDFTLWNLDLNQYEEGSAYPGVYAIESRTSEDYQLADSSFAPALFGTNYLYFENQDKASTFYFHLIKPEGIAFAVTLVPYDDFSVDLSKQISVTVERAESMDEILEMPSLKDMEGVYVVLSPVDKSFAESDHESDFDQGYLYYYFARYGEPQEEVTAEGGADAIEMNNTGQKEGEAATEAEGGIPLPTNLTLSIQNYDEDSVNFSWNRLNDSAIHSYELLYGKTSGDYSEKKLIERSYFTAASVTGLEEGTKYYFELVALDDEGDLVGNPSPEISLTPESWLFTDVSFLDEHYDSIAALTEEGIFAGYADGSFRPDSTINRAELLKILVEGRGLTPSADGYKNCFSDVTTEWFAKYVCYAKARAWVQGYSDGTFRPGNAVNKVEALKILFQVYEAGVDDGPSSAVLPYDDLNSGAWYAAYIAKAVSLGLLEEVVTGDFAPGNSRTRAEMAEELYRYLVVEALLTE